MKKIITIMLIVLSIVSIGNAGPFIKFEMGPSLNVDNVYFTEAIIGYKLRFWEIESQTYGGWLTWSSYNSLSGSPFMEIYSLNQKFIYKNLFFRFKHYCAHTVVSNYKQIRNTETGVEYTKTEPSPYWWYGDTTTLSIGFEYEWK